MALTSQQTKQGAGVTAVVGALALGGVVVSVLGPSASAARAAQPVQAAANVTVTGKADKSKVTDDTVFTISGEVTGAQPGTKIRLQRQQAANAANSSPVWTTLAYTTFTDKSNKFTLQVKMESSGTYNLRVLHPQDKEGPQAAYSNPFSVTVSASKS